MAFTDGFLTLTISGGETIDLKVRQFGAFGKAISADGLIPVWTQIGEDLQADFAVNMFSEGGQGFGGKGGWPQLKPSTVRDRERHGFEGAHPILWRKGTLGESLASKTAEGSVFKVTPNGVSVGTSIFYGGIHQSGSRDGKIPARPIVGLTWYRRSALVARLNDFIFNELQNAGLNG